MTNEKKLHPRNLHNHEYDFDALIQCFPQLAPYVKENKYGDQAVDYSDAKAVLALNQALLLYHYQVEDWSVPKGHLCPPIPGRADYLHYIADLLAQDHQGAVPVGTKIKGLDIGTGLSCIYPILGNSIYGWKFVGTDINPEAINHAKGILGANPKLKKNIKLRFQKSPDQIFKEMIKADEKFDFTMCNPPFYSSEKEALKTTERKVKNLNQNREKKGHAPMKTSAHKLSNFGGKNAELWCPGGELAFINQMITESSKARTQCGWFTTLVSNKEHLSELNQQLKNLRCAHVRTIQMHHGQKISHILAWRF